MCVPTKENPHLKQNNVSDSASKTTVSKEEQPMVATLQPQETVPDAKVSNEVYEPIQSSTVNSEKPSKFSEKQKKFCKNKVKNPHKNVAGHIHSKNRKDTTNCIVKNRKDPVICGVKKVKNKKNVKMCVPTKENPHLKQNDAISNTVSTGDSKQSQDDTCFVEQKDENGNPYYAEKNKTTNDWTNKTQWEKPTNDKICELLNSWGWESAKDENGVTYFYAKKSNDEFVRQYKIPEGPFDKDFDGCYVEVKDENGNPYYAEKNKQTGEWRTDSEARWDKPKDEEMCKEEPKRKWDASKTFNKCREMDLHPGAKYWIDEDGSMSFEPIEGKEPNEVEKETDYFYNDDNETTFNKYDGTCDEYLNVFLENHFNILTENDKKTKSKESIISWLNK